MAQTGIETAAEQVILGKIAQGLSDEEEANAYMTLALKYLEGAEFVKAHSAAVKVMTRSKNIEQRIAAIHLLQLSKKMDKDSVMLDLGLAYDM